MDRRAAAYVDELVRYVSNAGRIAHGRYPIDMTPMAYVSGALGALRRLDAITEPELRETLQRCHDAFGLKRPPAPPAGEGGGVAALAWKPEWRDAPPEPPRR